MASAKKGKKNKGKTLALSDFLQETPGPVSTMPIRKSTMNWADEVEDSHDLYESRSSKTSVILPTAPKASRDFDDIIDKVPQDPPYIAYLTNLPYDVDENEISAFFRNMKIANMRIPKDERPGEAPRLRGFGYVEFEDRESLLNALVIPDTTIKNRRIRIEVATDYGNDNRRGGGRMDMNRDRNNRSEMSSFGDWRSGPRQETNTDSDRDRRGGGGGGGFNRDRDRDRDRDDNTTWRSNREAPSAPPSRSRGFTRPPPRPTADEEDTRRSDEPRVRPKLMLTPRTKPVEVESSEKVAASTAIFGNAKPVDTSARERQIEERLARDHDVVPKEKDKKVEKEIENDVVEKEKEKPYQPKRNGDVAVVVAAEKKEVKTDKSEVRKKVVEEKKAEKEMPKLKKAEPPNFVASNKFAYLQTEEDSSD